MRGIPAVVLLVAAVTARTLTAGPQAPPSVAPPVDYARDIQPILQAACYECHGPTRQRGGLRLDDRAAALRGGESGQVIVPGRSEESLLVRRVLGLDGDEVMPKEGDPLSPAQIASLRAWIDRGASWPEQPPTDVADARQPRHWAYVRPADTPPPDADGSGWARNSIDRFVLARLQREGLTPSPEASLDTLIRRVFLDLIGLPPTIAELDAALADAAARGRDAAYERVVDALLASPHYGERWARQWLDLARYADSHGYEKDRLRVMWKYRDWVIDALNADMPFTQFTIEQIAGDMLPGATVAQRVASGFHRNTMLNQEGGIDVEEARWETLVDRVNTTATVWLGSTIGCAQCHNHKYDPFTQRDYYRLLAFFENVEYSIAGQQGGDRFADEPQIELATPEQEARGKRLQAEIDKLTASLRADTPARAAAQARWERAVLAAERAWLPLAPISFESSAGSRHERQDDGSILVTGENPGDNIYTIVAEAPAGGLTAIRVEALPDARLPKGGPGRDPYGNFVVNGFDVAVGAGARATPVAFASVKVDDGAGGVTLDNFQPAPDTSSYVPRGWTVDATRDPDTRRLRRQAVFVSKRPFGASGARLTITLRHVGRPIGQSLGRFRLSVTASPAPLKVVDIPAKLRPALQAARRERSEQQKKDLAAQFRAVAPAFTTTRTRIAARQKDLRGLGIIKALVMKERPAFERPSTYVRRRGNFLDKAQKVYAAVPAALPPLPDDVMPNRLGLAQWLVDERNPLTARVCVNRAWEGFFGRGLVETSEDFGTQGAPPSHPALLDWLAVQFVKDGWRMKPLHRSIVLSATYRQLSAVNAALLERDPYNRLLARGPRFRVEAEMVRDIALEASGLLSRKIGGPSVFPPQPEGIWQNPYSSEKWVTSTGEDRYRRGLYTFLRRTSPYPAFTTFDATSRESCTVRRVRTNTPLQALTTLNDEVFFEAARALARRMLNEAAPSAGTNGSGDTTRIRAAYGFRLVVSRSPKPTELDRITAAFAAHLEQFRTGPERARQVVAGFEVPGVSAPEQAAWTLVANALLNLDETVTKE